MKGTNRLHRPQPLRSNKDPNSVKNPGRSGTVKRYAGMSTQPGCETRRWQGIAVMLGRKVRLPSLHAEPCTYKVSAETGERLGFTDDIMWGKAWVHVWNSRNAIKVILEVTE